MSMSSKIKTNNS